LNISPNISFPPFLQYDLSKGKEGGWDVGKEERGDYWLGTFFLKEKSSSFTFEIFLKI
jgi:hypothetical protein